MLRALLSRMTEPICEYVADMLIREPVVHDPTLLTTLDDMARSQQPELMAHGRLSHADKEREVTDAQFLSEAQGMDDPRAVRVSKQAEDLGDAASIGEREHLVEERGDMLGCTHSVSQRSGVSSIAEYMLID